MNNKFLKRTNTAIELTSLLDVIFIVLMVVICSKNYEATAKIENAENKVIEAEAAMQEADKMMDAAEVALTENAMLKEQVELCSDIFSQVTLVTVSVSYTPSMPQQRIIRIAVNDEAPKELTKLTPKEPSKGFDELSEHLTAILEEANGRPVILSVDDSRILYRDSLELVKLLNRFRSYGNLYEKAGKDE